jgi:hypothetical protein
VAGPNVYICDACVAVASRIMSDPGIPEARQPRPAPSLWRRIRDWFERRGVLREA